MVHYSFNPRFADPIRRGLGLISNPFVYPKTQTIRAIGRKRHAREGEVVQLYVGLRTRHCAKLGEALCVSSQRITIKVNEDLIIFPNEIVSFQNQQPSKRLHALNDLDEFAKKDGFKHWRDMQAFWLDTHGALVCANGFEGVLVTWRRK